MKNNILLNEINTFKEAVNIGGILLVDYVKTAKKLKNKINVITERKMKFLKYVLSLNMITTEQYYKHKNLIEAEKIYYKDMLSLM